VQLIDISQELRDSVINKLQQKAPIADNVAHSLFQSYFSRHPEQLDLIDSNDCNLGLLVTAMIRWNNNAVETAATTSSRIAVSRLQRI
jgi:hypothetical protein